MMESFGNLTKEEPNNRFIPATAYLFSSWSNIGEPRLSPLNNLWIKPGSATLIVGDKASELVVFWAKSNKVDKFYSNSLYLKAEAPWETDFLNLLTRSQKQMNVELHVSKECKLQDFPIPLKGCIKEERLFRWIILNKEVPPWQRDKMLDKKMSLLEKVLYREELNPSMIILDGFYWPERMTDVRMMLKRLKEKSISIVMLNSEKPPKGFSANSIWDNVAEIRPWRTWRCGKYDIVFKYHKYDRRKIEKRVRLFSRDGINWEEKDTYYEFLKPYLLWWFKAENPPTAAQVVKAINDNFHLTPRMTMSTLARLKREWGLRTYRPEKKPRKKKTPRNQSVPPLPSDKQI